MNIDFTSCNNGLRRSYFLQQMGQGSAILDLYVCLAYGKKIKMAWGFVLGTPIETDTRQLSAILIFHLGLAYVRTIKTAHQ